MTLPLRWQISSIDLKDPHALHCRHRFYKVSFVEKVNISVIQYTHWTDNSDINVSQSSNTVLACLGYKVSSAYHNIISTKSITLCIRKFDVPRASITCIHPINCTFGPGKHKC